MTLINELYKLIEEEGKELAGHIRLDNDGGRSIIIVEDDNAETSDEVVLYESYGVYDTYEFLENNGYLRG